MTADLVTWLTAAFNEIERAARAACHEWANAEGEQWQWIVRETDREPTADDVYPPTIANSYRPDLSLRSVARYGVQDGRALPHFAIPSTEEPEVGAAAHIALHDPRSALARVEAERFILALHEGSHECSSWNEMHGEYDSCCWVVDGGCSTVYALAYGHRHDIPGWRAEWAPEGVAVDA